MQFEEEIVAEDTWEIGKIRWEGKGWSDEWRMGWVVLVLKKGKKRRVEDYRGVTLM